MSSTTPATALVLRRANATDLPGIVALLADDRLGTTREDTRSPLHPRYLRAFQAIDADPNQLAAVAEQDGLVGCLQISFIPQVSHFGALRGQISGVRIARDHRGRGLGRIMIGWAIEQCRTRQCDMVQLTSDKGRLDALRFYTALGFEASHEGLKLVL